jgi:NAD(P)-dependent dehydrogenase (short-subunit alcohol dehydrogenase family)
MISLAGKAALITGGSRGIGAATVKMFAQAGADVVFGYHKDRDAAEQVAQEAAKHGTRIESFKADLGKMAEAKKLVDFAREQLGRIDILVANAGIYDAEGVAIERLTEREWDEMVRVNLKSVYAVSHFCAPHMIAQKSGRIVTISSGAAQRGSPLRSHYSATKGAIISFTKSLALELAPHNILVNCVSPGFVETDMSAPYLKTKKGLKFATGISPLQRIGKPEEVAGPILFAVSDLATFMTGQVINVNGGSI